MSPSLTCKEDSNFDVQIGKHRGNGVRHQSKQLDNCILLGKRFCDTRLGIMSQREKARVFIAYVEVK